ncbi:MAG TPA: NAD-dependent protein deacylase [Feifaniaceae bacterium]|nr:NAD-dependent protein deacylase [Feifaniaceae bacterium]
MQAEIERLRRAAEKSKRIVFLGGAGVSTESGIPDFRSKDGIFEAIKRFGHPPETLLSHDFFLSHTDTFYHYYRTMLLYPDAKPNAAHEALAELERRGKLIAVVTQNIDGLHQQAGSESVLELHGSVCRNSCMACGKRYGLNDIINGEGVPKCGCGGVIRPDVVLYGEMLDDAVVNASIRSIQMADLLIVGGTSLTVYPAASLAQFFHGNALALINLSTTPMDERADIVIRERIGEVLRACI